MIEVEQLRKSYGELIAVDSVSFAAHPGEIFGLLGPNGAGKTTTIGCISGLLVPSAGHVKVMGHDVAREGPAARAALGVVPQEIALYEDLSAHENLAYWGGAQGMQMPGYKLESAQWMGARDMTTAMVAVGSALGLETFEIGRLANAFRHLIACQRGNGRVLWRDIFHFVGLPE